MPNEYKKGRNPNKSHIQTKKRVNIFMKKEKKIHESKYSNSFKKYKKKKNFTKKKGKDLIYKQGKKKKEKLF